MKTKHVSDDEVDELTDLHLMILSVLWRLRTATVSRVADELAGQTAIARKTVATLLSRLESRGIVAREMSGREAVYSAMVSRKRVMLRRVGGVLGALFGPSLSGVSALGLAQSDGRAGELERLRALLERATREVEDDPV